jgi:molybdopterin synthase catalytic subunit
MIRVQQADFDLGAESAALCAGRTDLGAVVTFTGLVRDATAGEHVSTLFLEHYPGMTESELERIEAEARARWPLQDCLIIHRYGALQPGDNIVLVITASVHRRAAFEAAEFIMDFLKTSAPFWKREEGTDGGRWVGAKADDDEARERWIAKSS